jgi:hypothetical protein
MKYLLSILFVLAVFFGCASSAQAQNFRVQVLDPLPNLCGANPIASGCIVFDPSSPINIDLTPQACTFAGVAGLPSSGDYGCAILLNLSIPPQDITSLNMTFGGLDSLTFDCLTGGLGIFSNANCGPLGGGVDGFSFFNGSFGPGQIAIIYEDGINPCPDGECTLFQGGTGTLNDPPLVIPTPEPNSLLLLATGGLMAGLYLAKRQRLFAFTNK